MSLTRRLLAWIAPFSPKPAPNVHQESEEQSREADRLLRQLRAELNLVRRWREDTSIEDGLALRREVEFWEKHGGDHSEAP